MSDIYLILTCAHNVIKIDLLKDISIRYKGLIILGKQQKID